MGPAYQNIIQESKAGLTPCGKGAVRLPAADGSLCIMTKPQRCINIWSKSTSFGLYQAIKKRLPIFKTLPYVYYAFVLENAQSPFANPIFTVLNSNFMQRWGKHN